MISIKNLVRRLLFFSILTTFLVPRVYDQANPKPSGIESIAVGLRPSGVAVDPKTDRAVVANRDSNTVSIIDLSKRESTTVAVGAQPEGVAIKPAPNPNDTALAVVANGGDNTISVISLDKMAVLYTVDVDEQPYGVAVNPGTNRAVVTNSGSSSVSVVDLEAGTVIATIGVDENPHGVAINPITNMAVVASRAGNVVSVIDLNRNQLLATVEVDTEPEGVAINPEIGQYGIAAVTNLTEKGGQVTLINLADYTIGAQIDVDPEPVGVAINLVTNQAIVAHKKSDSASLIDLSAGTIIDRLSVGREPLGVALHPDINLALVTDNGAQKAAPGSLELIQLAYPIPAISDLSPELVEAGSPEFVLTINGNRFFRTSTVSVDQMPLEANFINFRQLQVRVPAAFISQAKIVQVRTTNPPPGGGTSGPATLTINNPIPVIDRITPSELPAGGSGFEMTVAGAGFVSGSGGNSVVRFNDAPKPTRFVSARELRAQISAADIASPGLYPVVVTNPQPDGGSSNSNAVNFTNASLPPVISNVSPGIGSAGATVTINGANFVSVPPGPTSVTFAGPGDTRVMAVIASLTNTVIVTVVPPGAVTGKIRVTTARGSALSQNDFTVALPASYTVTATPALAEVPQGDSTNFDVRVDSRDGFTGLVGLSAAGLPSGVSVQFSPTQIAPGSSAVLQVRVDRSAAAGRVNFRVQGQADISGRPVASEASAALEIIDGRVTTVSGRVVTSDDMPRPLVDVAVSVVRFEAQPPPGRFVTIVPAVRTNTAGSFLLRSVPVGRQMLLIDGPTGRDPQSPERRFPPVEEPVNVVSSQANPTPFTIHLPAIDQASRTPTPPNPPSDIRAMSPSVPNLEVRIPAGTTITRPDGTVATEVTLTPVPTDRAPGLLPPGVIVPMLFSVQPGGAVPSIPTPVSFPNLLNTPPGTRMNLWTFDVSISEWRTYGTGTVSPDGTQILPDIDPATGRPFGLRRFAWHFPAPPPPPDSCDCHGGDPVALTSGAFFENKTDISINRRVSIAISRIYQTRNTSPGPFGIGTVEANYGQRIQQQGSTFIYTVPTVGTSRFTPIAGRPNQFENTTDPSLKGVVLTREAGEFNFTLRLQDGTVLRFDRIVGFANAAGLSAITDRNGNAITLTRGTFGGQFGLLTQVRDPDGLTLRLDYNASGRVQTVTDPIGRQVRYTYNAAGYLETVTNPEGGVTRYRYDAQGRMTEITNPRGFRVVLNEYDAQGRVQRQTHADGGVFRYDYRVVGGQITETRITDPRGKTTTHRFNCMGFLATVTNPSGQVTLFDRSIGTNRINFAQDPLRRRAEFGYDARNNIIQTRDPAGQVRRYEYDPTFNEVTAIVDELGNRTTTRYDARGNPIEIVDPEGHSTTSMFNSRGQVLTATDASGNVTTFEYDGQGNLAATIDPEGNRTTLRYDGVGRLIARTDPRGRTTRFAYDVMDRIVEATDPQERKTRFTYDPNGNVLTITDPLGRTITHAYDNQDRLERRVDPLGNVSLYVYDQNGNVLRATDRRGQVATFTYDDSDRLFGITRSDGSTTTHAYDGVGRLIRITDSVGGTIEFTYDAANRLMREVTPQGALSYEYDGAGHRTRMTVAGQPAVTYRYDRAGRLMQVQQGSDLVTMDYDRADRQTRRVLPNGMAIEYTYDRAERLVTITFKRRDGTVADTINYSYDANGHRSNVQGTVPYGAAPDNPVAPIEYNRANQLLRFGNRTFTYDQNGNLQTQTDPSGAVRYEWDARNRLTSIRGPGLDARFAYDALGRRIGKEINGQSINYLYDGLDVIEELSGARVQATYLRNLEIDEPFTRSEAGRKSHYLVDGLNSTLFLTDDDGGRVQQYTYDAFGRIVLQSGSSTNAYTYTGREWDGASGLYYYRARYYDPTTGRFISEDPLGSLNGTNLYPYADDNPINFVDPHGEFIQYLIGAGTSVATGYIIAKLTGSCYSWKDALIDAGVGALGVGIASKLQKLYRIQKLRSLAKARGLINQGQKGYVETWKSASTLERLNIKFEAGKSAGLQKGSLRPRFDYRTANPGEYWDPFTGRTGTGQLGKDLAHTPLEPPLTPAQSGGAGAAAGAASGGARSQLCGCN
jgi:RHS repeat-associated protein